MAYKDPNNIITAIVFEKTTLYFTTNFVEYHIKLHGDINNNGDMEHVKVTSRYMDYPETEIWMALNINMKDSDVVKKVLHMTRHYWELIRGRGIKCDYAK